MKKFKMKVHKQTSKLTDYEATQIKRGTKNANSNPPAKSSNEELEGIKIDIVNISC